MKMKCARCQKSAVFRNPAYCREHFISYIERKVWSTIARYKLIGKNDAIFVACSGGKDSTVCLHILSQRYQVEALAIDEGIAGYRDLTLLDLRAYCAAHRIPLHVYSIKHLFGKTLDELLKKGSGLPCTLCGAFRRSLLNRCARELGATVIATGHNLDDEAQSVLMNFLRNQLAVSARLGPATGLVKDLHFVPRVKPMYFCTEKEITAYAYLMNFSPTFTECPYTWDSYRNTVRAHLNTYEENHRGTKKALIRSFLHLMPMLKARYRTTSALSRCHDCGEPCAADRCQVCSQLKKFQMKKY
jgi:tRNA-5-methyluridine54 2-sulfurtransferase